MGIFLPEITYSMLSSKIKSEILLFDEVAPVMITHLAPIDWIFLADFFIFDIFDKNFASYLFGVITSARGIIIFL